MKQDQKTHIVNIRMTDSMLKVIDGLAKKYGKSRSGIMRDVFRPDYQIFLADSMIKYHREMLEHYRTIKKRMQKTWSEGSGKVFRAKN